MSDEIAQQQDSEHLTERERDAQRKREDRESARDVELSEIANPQRRADALGDVFGFLGLYFGHRFYNPMTEMHREIVRSILHRAKNGGDQAIAAPRGEGKTTIAECVITYALLSGRLRFPVIVAATGPDAKRILDNIKHEFETNELLAADFPEICDPILALGGGTSRQNMQTVAGERTRLRWSTDYIVLPKVPGRLGGGYSKNVRFGAACGAVLMTRGLDGSIRGLRHESTRPDFILIDDPETRESAASDLQIGTREKTIDRDIGGLSGQSKKLARIALVTLQNEQCLAAKLTDRTQKPSWLGRRYAAIQKWPENMADWQEYMEIRKSALERDDEIAQEATDHYAARRERMDFGAVLANQFNYVAEVELSALQHCFNFIADKGMEAFMAECQNQPLPDENVETSGLNWQKVSKQISGLGRGVCPVGSVLTAYCDTGKHQCHWAVCWWLNPAIGGVLDYGIVEINQPDQPTAKTLNLAILGGLQRWRDDLLANPIHDEAGEERRINMAMVNAAGADIKTRAAWDDAVYDFCRSAGAPFFPSIGAAKYQDATRSQTRQPGFHFYKSLQANRQWLYVLDSTYWKRWCHDRFLTDTLDDNKQRHKGSLSLFVPVRDREHHSFAHHICAEGWAEEFVRGKGVVGKMIQHSANNHWLDAVAGCCAAANVQGIKLLGDQKTHKPMSLAEMRAAAKGKA